MKLFPVGTSRLHEPLSIVDNPSVEVCFPKMGYFHSSSQVISLMGLLKGNILDLNTSRLFFRKDSINVNIFDENLWSNLFLNSVSRLVDEYEKSDVLLVEISSARSYFLNSFYIQGNPNFFRNLPYSDVWKNGYYEVYHPELDVEIFDDYDLIFDNLFKLNKILECDSKYAIIMGHLVDPRKPNSIRQKCNLYLQLAVDKINSPRLRFYDQSSLVEKYGFRVLDGGVIDIHHLPWDALPIQMNEIISML